jgi:hypothetical protein
MSCITLTPKLPPGRANRKALAFAVEINRLRAAGYSYEAIRSALLEVGVVVSQTTVKREVSKAVRAAMWARASAQPPIGHFSSRSQAPSTPEQPPLLKFGSAEVDAPPRPRAPSVGEDIADKFMKGRVTNSLLKEGTRNESRCD